MLPTCSEECESLLLFCCSCGGISRLFYDNTGDKEPGSSGRVRGVRSGSEITLNNVNGAGAINGLRTGVGHPEGS